MVVFMAPQLFLWMKWLSFAKRGLNKINFKINTESGETNKVCWRKYSMQVKKSSNFSDPEIIYQAKLQKYENNDLFVRVVSIFKSVYTALCMK